MFLLGIISVLWINKIIYPLMTKLIFLKVKAIVSKDKSACFSR